MIEVKVVARTQEAVDIFSYELVSVDGELLPAFSAGAHIDVHLPNGLMRQYSLCNHSEDRNRYVIGVLKDPASRGGSKAMHDHVRAGQNLIISEPRNLFPLNLDAKRTLLFAGGIGVTPILCMAETLYRLGMDFEMHYCARSLERTAFQMQILTSLFVDKVFFHFDERPETAMDAASLLAVPQADVHLYVCGPNGFMQHVLDTGKAQGWSEDNLHREYFSAAPVDISSNGVFSVKISSTGNVYQIPADQSVQQVLGLHGIDIPISCEQGVCGTCLTRVLEGVPDHRDMYLTEKEHAANDQFTPCCSRSKTPLLVIDI